MSDLDPGRLAAVIHGCGVRCRPQRAGPRTFERFDRAGAALVADAAATLPAADRRALAAALPALEQLRDAVTAQRPALPPPPRA
ncbi:hypothetical protein PV341_08380 [Streptomyces sp. PA03-1a]|nr:hypothetical protein [Streptomyces sp. PA03-1a]